MRRGGRWRLIGIVVVVVLALGGAAVWFFLGASSTESSSSAATDPEDCPESGEVEDALRVVHEFSGALAVKVTVDVPTEQDRVHSIIGAGTLTGDVAELTFDASDSPNAGGIFGHFDSVPAVYAEDDAYFRVVPGEAPWLALDMADAGTERNADIARLRDLTLANPGLLLEVAGSAVDDEGECVPAGGELALSGTADLRSASSELLQSVATEYGVEAVPYRLLISPEGELRAIEVQWDYPVVPGAPDSTRVDVTMTFEEGGDGAEPQEPAEDEVVTLEELSG